MTDANEKRIVADLVDQACWLSLKSLAELVDILTAMSADDHGETNQGEEG